MQKNISLMLKLQMPNDSSKIVNVVIYIYIHINLYNFLYTLSFSYLLIINYCYRVTFILVMEEKINYGANVVRPFQVFALLSTVIM